MKVKFDFVTNSSSISYVVFVPKGMTVTEEEFRYYIENENWDEVPDEDLPNIIKYAKQILRTLSAGGQIFEGSYDYVSYGFIRFLLEEKGLILGDINTIGDSGAMVGTSKNRIERAFMAINKSKIRELCNVEVKK